jgi:L-lactate dehydrogenase complex protein LldG
MSAREAILDRVRAATADVPRAEPPLWDPAGGHDTAVAYRVTTALDRAALVDLFVERAGAYRAHVGRAESIAAGVAAACERHGAARLAVPGDVPEAWLPEVAEILRDDPPLALDALDAVDGVLTGCAVAIAETGTVVLGGAPHQGRRALTLVPDLHVCVVAEDQIVGTVPEAIRLLGAAVRAQGAPLTFVSGPSATSDIELSRVEGVHGPRRLELVVVPATSPSTSSKEPYR